MDLMLLVIFLVSVIFGMYLGWSQTAISTKDITGKFRVVGDKRTMVLDLETNVGRRQAYNTITNMPDGEEKEELLRKLEAI